MSLYGNKKVDATIDNVDEVANAIGTKTLTIQDNLANIRLDRLSPNKYSEAIMRGTNTIISTSFQIVMRGAPINSLYPTLQTTAEQLQIASNSANDTSAGTGLRQILIEGVDSNWDDLSEIITLNGQTPVTTTNTFRGVNNLTGISAGSLDYNDGDISVSNSTDTFSGGEPDNVLLYCIKNQWSSSNLGVHFVPRNSEYVPINYITNTSATESKPIEANVFIKPFGLPRQYIALQTFSGSASNYELKAMPKVPERSIAYVEARNTSSGSNEWIVWFQFIRNKTNETET